MPPQPKDPIQNLATEYTQRLIIVVRAAMRQMAEEMAIVADPEGGAGTFIPGTPLRVAGDATNTPVAYWTGWTMTQEQRDRLTAEFGRRAGSFDVFVKGNNIRMNRQYWAFASAEQAGPTVGFNFTEVLGILGFDVFGSQMP